jgi:hypothetical protein
VAKRCLKVLVQLQAQYHSRLNTSNLLLHHDVLHFVDSGSVNPTTNRRPSASPIVRDRGAVSRNDPGMIAG